MAKIFKIPAINAAIIFHWFNTCAALAQTPAPTPSASSCTVVQQTLFAGTDYEELSQGGALPDHLGKYTVNGPTVTGTKVIDINFPLNGIAAVNGVLVTGDPRSNVFRILDFDGRLLSTASTSMPPDRIYEDIAYDTRDPAHPVIWRFTGTNGIMYKLDPTSYTVLTTYSQDAVIGITPVGNELWIAKLSPPSVGKWNPETNVFTPVFTTQDPALAIAYDAYNDFLWVGQGEGKVVPYRLDGSFINAGFYPFGPGHYVDGLELVTTMKCPAPCRIDPWALPNPFKLKAEQIHIDYSLPQDARVDVAIYGPNGALVRTLSFAPGSRGGSAGANDVTWDGRDGRDPPQYVSPGTYVGDLAVSSGTTCRALIRMGAR